MTKILCVYYSRSGLTREIMSRIAEGLGAELIEITDGRDRSGALGYIAAAFAALSKKLPRLLPFETAQPLSEYETIVLGAPIWAERVCPVARAFLTEHRGELTGELYYVMTHMSDLDYAKPIARLEQFAGKPCAGSLSLQTKNHDCGNEIDALIEKLRH